MPLDRPRALRNSPSTGPDSNRDKAAALKLASAPPVEETKCITLGHGSGGKLTKELTERLLLPAFRNPALEALDDHAALDLPNDGRLALTTDSYVITPLFFRGGDIGRLAVNGTVNDLAMGGAVPWALSLAFILEEGLPLETFERIVQSTRDAAQEAGVVVVTGDTKVVDHGSADKLFINTAGVGVIPKGVELGSARVRAGDAILLSGTIGDHGVAILSQRHGIELEGNITSDTAPLHDLARAIVTACPDTHAMRDPTRGGLAATLVEIATRRKLGIDIEEAAIPVRGAVRGACELLGLDPLFVANEGKLVAFVPQARANQVLSIMRGHPLGRRAACIGRVVDNHPHVVSLRTPSGGHRILDLPFDEPLPRIC